MILTVHMKTPDALGAAIAEGLIRMREDGRDQQEAEDEAEAAREVAKRWVRYGEYLTVVIDTETKTAAVKEMR